MDMDIFHRQIFLIKYAGECFSRLFNYICKNNINLHDINNEVSVIYSELADIETNSLLRKYKTLDEINTVYLILNWYSQIMNDIGITE